MSDPSFAPLAEAPRRSGPRRWLGRLGWGLLALAFAALVVGATFHTDRGLVLPGRADGLEERITVGGQRVYPAKGDVLWATVGVRRSATLLELVRAWLDPSIDVYANRTLFGDETREQTRVRNQVAMDDAKQVAAVVALRRLGYTPAGKGVVVTRTFPGMPADGVVKPKETITAVDGKPLCLLGDLRAAIGAHQPGDRVTLTIATPAGATRTATVALVLDPDTNRTILGVQASTARCTLPFTVDIDTGRVGGPSAGLAMTLAFLDRLSPGELTGGVKVATTGTIEADGSVGPVGGVKQKTLAVRAAGAKLFLVPADEYDEARAHAGTMQVAPVRSLDEALTALRHAGGTPIAGTSPSPDTRASA